MFHSHDTKLNMQQNVLEIKRKKNTTHEMDGYSRYTQNYSRTATYHHVHDWRAAQSFTRVIDYLFGSYHHYHNCFIWTNSPKPKDITFTADVCKCWGLNLISSKQRMLDLNDYQHICGYISSVALLIDYLTDGFSSTTTNLLFQETNLHSGWWRCLHISCQIPNQMRQLIRPVWPL